MNFTLFGYFVHEVKNLFFFTLVVYQKTSKICELKLFLSKYFVH